MRIGIIALLLVVELAACVGRQSAERLGAVSSTDAAATDVGIAMLQRGGNAIDAAVAVALALAVVNPQAGNLGGGGFAVIRYAGEITSLDFRETAPAAAHRNMYLAADGTLQSGASTIGPLAAGVPGAAAGYFELQRKFGALTWRDVVSPAIALAKQGLTISPRIYGALARKRHVFERFAETRAYWLPHGNLPVTGSVIALDDLAQTLERYATLGPTGVTEGPVAAAVVAVSARHGGILTAADLSNYRPEWRAPVVFSGFGWQVAAMNLPSSGGIVFGQSIYMLQRLGWAKLAAPADRMHALAETWRRAYADRYRLGDPETSEANAQTLLAPEWLGGRLATIDMRAATPSGQIAPWPEHAAVESVQTTHLSTVDRFGNAVAMTVTLNGTFGGGVFVPGAGFFLNNEMDDFASLPGQANMYGLVQGEANAIAPGKRMLSSMTPAIAWRGADVLALGSPGGSRIPTATVQAFLQRVALGLDLSAAVNAPRMHHQWQPDAIFVEPDTLDAATAATLTGRGHVIQPARWHIGEIYAVERVGGVFAAAADRRVEGAAASVASTMPLGQLQVRR